MKFKKISTLLDSTGPFKNNLFILFALTCFNALFEALNVGLYLPLIAWATGQQTSNAINTKLDSILVGVDAGTKVLVGLGALALIVVIKTCIKLYMNWYSITFFTNLRIFWISCLHDNFLQSKLLDFQKVRNGEKINLMSNEVNLAIQAVSDFTNLIIRISVMGSYFIVLVATSWQTTLMVIFISMFFGGVYFKFGKKSIIDISHRRHLNDSKLWAFLAESLSGVKQIKIYGLYDQIQRKRLEYLKIYQGFTQRLDVLEKLPLPLGELILIVSASLALLFIKTTKDENVLGYIPTLGVFALTLKPLLTQITDAASLKIGFDNRWKSFTIVYDWMKNYKNREHQGTIESKFPLSTGINIRSLTYGYPGQLNKVFNDFSCHIPNTGLVLIKGQSGKGKSTLVNLIQGFYDDYKGQILFDDYELKELDLIKLRRNISYVTQEHYLFHGTIRENLVPQSSSISDDEILSVLEKVSMREYVESQASGLDSLILEGATSLSGGQKQRLSIARAILHHPAIMFLDEPTNALDNVSREVIIQTLYDLAKSMSIIIITHDESAFTLPETLEIKLA